MEFSSFDTVDLRGFPNFVGKSPPVLPGTTFARSVTIKFGQVFCGYKKGTECENVTYTKA